MTDASRLWRELASLGRVRAVKRIDATCFCGASGSHSVTELELADRN